jgi:glucokinase
MPFLLAVDLGGTKTLCQISADDSDFIFEQSFPSQNYASLYEVLTEFLSQPALKDISIASACLAVAGPVSGHQAFITNLPWVIDANELAHQLNIGRVVLCNDFEAVGYGISCLSDDEVITLQEGLPVEGTPRAVIGAGTGLGQAILLPTQAGWTVLPTEGGHCDFAPTSKLQILLLEHMKSRFGQVSYERLVSGVGIVAIYEFLRSYTQHDELPELRQAMINGDPSAAISQFALAGSDKLAQQTMTLFVEIYGSQAGNLSLSVLPKNGLYIAGGIAAKNVALFQGDTFLTAFNAKGKMANLVKTIPVRLILQPRVGLLGARELARQGVKTNYDA